MNLRELEDQVYTVIVGTGQQHPALYADLDQGAHTVATTDPEACLLFDALEQRLRLVGEAQDVTAPTAVTRAALAEARRVRPRVASWHSEPDAVGPRFRLPPPEETLAISVGSALTSRRSTRHFDPLDPRALSTLLYHSARIHDFLPSEDGYPATARAAPSAGARHPIDLILVADVDAYIPAPGEAQSSAYLFEPLTCQLVALPSEDAEWVAAVPSKVELLIGSRPPVTLILGARLERTFSRYRGGLSLVYRDAGAFMAVIATVASALQLNCCVLATPTETVMPMNKWIDVGGLAIGGRPP